MFTGIIQDVGRIAALDKRGDWIVSIATALPLGQTALGASIACNGICLTVVAKTDDSFTVQVSAETLSKTTAVHWRDGGFVNLEPALRMGDELGGHLLSGHVDGVARVAARAVDGDSIRYIFEVPAAFAKFLAPKGSVAINGISLTINSVSDMQFGVNIIPHTQQKTTIGKLAVGDEVNFEVDMIARYLERMMNSRMVA